MEVITTVYKAFDGNLFESKEECKKYETEQRKIQNFNIKLLLNSISFAENANIDTNINIFRPVFIDKVLLHKANSIKELNERAEKMNIIVIKEISKFNYDILMEYITNETFRNIFKKVKLIKDRTEFKKYDSIIFYKVEGYWYSVDEILNKAKNIYDSIATISNFCLR